MASYGSEWWPRIISIILGNKQEMPRPSLGLYTAENFLEGDPGPHASLDISRLIHLRQSASLPDLWVLASDTSALQAVLA